MTGMRYCLLTASVPPRPYYYPDEICLCMTAMQSCVYYLTGKLLYWGQVNRGYFIERIQGLVFPTSGSGRSRSVADMGKVPSRPTDKAYSVSIASQATVLLWTMARIGAG